MKPTQQVTLLDRAHAVSTRRGRPAAGEDSQERLVLAVAWLRGEVTYNQAAAVLGMSGESSAAAHLVSVLRAAIRDGRAHVMVLR